MDEEITPPGMYTVAYWKLPDHAVEEAVNFVKSYTDAR